MTRLRITIICLLLYIPLTAFSIDAYSAFAIILTLWCFLDFLRATNDTLAFREFVLLLYAVNFLLSPAIIYMLQDDTYTYSQKIPPSEFFSLTIPAIIILRVTLFLGFSKIFKVEFLNVLVESALNRNILVQWVIFGTSLKILSAFLPGELAFVGYLIAMVRYIAAFGLLMLNRKKNFWYLVVLFLIELMFSVKTGMFGDFFMWGAFTLLLLAYLYKPSFTVKMTLLVSSLFILTIVQISKGDYRQQTWMDGEEGGFERFSDIVGTNLYLQSGEPGSNVALNVFTRLNQGWILSSTVRNMDNTRDFQGLNLLGKYLESAFLPRFLAPNKLNSGDKEIFNKFSGHRISGNTSMGLGIIADGYIAYGSVGVYLYVFGLGLLFLLVFRVVQSWLTTSKFFVLFLFPIFFYAVRPDCETQTLLGHMVKATFLFTILVKFYKSKFSKQIAFKSSNLSAS